MGKRGKPLFYATVQELEEKIEEYFLSINGEALRDKNGEMVFDKYDNPVMVGRKPPTITGLAYFLGFASRQALLNYECKKDYHDAITRAKLRVEGYAEERLFDRDGVNGAKFALVNNFKGWKEKPTDDTEADALVKAAALLAGVKIGADAKTD